MKVHLLMTPEIAVKKPESAMILFDFGELEVIFGDYEDEKSIIRGRHCVIEDTEEIIIDWLKQFDGVPIGNGNPIQERFEIKHIKQ